MLLFEGCVCNSKGPRSSRNDKGAIVDTCLTKLELVVGIEGKGKLNRRRDEMIGNREKMRFSNSVNGLFTAFVTKMVVRRPPCGPCPYVITYIAILFPCP